MKGERLSDGEHYCNAEPGCYWRDPRGWAAITPNGLAAGLARHDVEEHDDGTITVAPSILVTRALHETWHGYLEHGVWREV